MISTHAERRLATPALSGFLALAVLACACTPGSSDLQDAAGDVCPCPVGQCARAPAAARFGLYDDNLLSRYEPGLQADIALLGARPGYVLWFLQIDDPFPTTIASVNDSADIATVLSIGVRSLQLDSARNDTLLREVAFGVWDSVLAQCARDARSFGKTVYYRFGFEMNGDWFPWGGKPADFVAAWRRTHGIFEAEGASNVRWVFSPNALWDNRTFEADILPYYPGDSLVDIVGLDGYNYGNGYDQWHHWQSLQSIFAPSLRACLSFGKPLWVSETACPSGPGRPQWLDDGLAFIDRNPCIDALFWFNAQKPGEPDFRLESDSASLEIVREWLHG